MKFSPDGLERRKTYLTQRLYETLRTSTPTVDPFTQTNDQPKAFRVGECTVLESGRRARFSILLFWKTDTRSEQRPINVTAEKIENKWLIDSITE